MVPRRWGCYKGKEGKQALYSESSAQDNMDVRVEATKAALFQPQHQVALLAATHRPVLCLRIVHGTRH